MRAVFARFFGDKGPRDETWRFGEGKTIWGGETVNEPSDMDKLIGNLAGFVTFICAWIYCMATYGFLFGFGLGWLPAAILAVMVFFGMAYLWRWVAGLLAIGLLYVLTRR